MDRKTYNALRTVMGYVKSTENSSTFDHPDRIYKEMELVRSWMQEVEKDIDD